MTHGAVTRVSASTALLVVTFTGCARHPAPPPAAVTITSQTVATSTQPSPTKLPAVGKEEACKTYDKNARVILNSGKNLGGLTSKDGWKWADSGMATAASDAVAGLRTAASNIDTALSNGEYPDEITGDLKELSAAVKDLAQKIADQMTGDVIHDGGARMNASFKKLDTYCDIQ